MQWINGAIEKCYPQDIEILPELQNFEYLFEDDDDRSNFSWETESVESIGSDITDEASLENVASRLDFVRNRMLYLKEAFKQHNIKENFGVSFRQNVFEFSIKDVC